jgi:hypothetical protein
LQAAASNDTLSSALSKVGVQLAPAGGSTTQLLLAPVLAEPSKQQDGGLSPTQTAGIVIGVVFGCFILAVAGVALYVVSALPACLLACLHCKRMLDCMRTTNQTVAERMLKVGSLLCRWSGSVSLQAHADNMPLRQMPTLKAPGVGQRPGRGSVGASSWPGRTHFQPSWGRQVLLFSSRNLSGL